MRDHYDCDQSSKGSEAETHVLCLRCAEFRHEDFSQSELLWI
jgi:hypothetical protein